MKEHSKQHYLKSTATYVVRLTTKDDGVTLDRLTTNFQPGPIHLDTQEAADLVLILLRQPGILQLVAEDIAVVEAIQRGMSELLSDRKKPLWTDIHEDGSWEATW